MCGIAGFTAFNGNPEPVLGRMINLLRHRGPDDDGTIVSGSNGIGMSRLAIIDVAHGHQPISTPDGALSIVFNGEIYNYRDIKRELEAEGVPFNTNSDTETILLAYLRSGPACLNLLRGMFTFAILDHRDGSLFVARDRLGVKPLYYATVGNQFVFASEIKAIIEHPGVSREVNPLAVDDYLSLRYVPGPQTLFKGIRKFPQAHYLFWKDGSGTFHRYWQPDSLEPWTGSLDAAQDAFDSLFDEATRLRMISERPVGAFLSGGLDSTAIVASLAKQFPKRLQTFSVGFGWEGDELAAAAQTAGRLGCDHHEIICRAEDTSLLPRIIWHLDEPVGDGIILPMFLLSQLASRTVTVVQSGEGADEILGGYFMHRVMHWASLYSRHLSTALQDGIILPAVERMPAKLLNLFFDYPGELGEAGKRRLLEFLRILRNKSTAAQYMFMISLFSGGDKQGLYSDSFRASLLSHEDGKTERSILDFNAMLGLQFAHWLPDDILCKLDKITMANSLEGRVPFMDHKLVELVTSFPPEYKLSMRRNKRLLRNYLRRNNIADVAVRRKVPFYIPIDQYLSVEPMRGMVEDLLSEKSVRSRGLFRWEAVRDLKATMGQHGFLFGKQIFSLLMLEQWYRIFIDHEKGWL